MVGVAIRFNRRTGQYAASRQCSGDQSSAGVQSDSRITRSISPTSGLFGFEAAMVVPRVQPDRYAGAFGVEWKGRDDDRVECRRSGSRVVRGERFDFSQRGSAEAGGQCRQKKEGGRFGYWADEGGHR